MTGRQAKDSQDAAAIDPNARTDVSARQATRMPQRLGGFVARLSFELLVVFIGVTLAFLAENRRKERERAVQAQEVYAALAAELADHTTVGQHVLDEYLKRQRDWDEAFARGERPIPWFIPWSRSGPPRAAWDATLASGGIGVIDPRLFYELAKYYRLVEVYMVPVDGPDPFVDTEIVPHLEQGADAFYSPGKHHLRPKYQAYLERRRTVLTGAQYGINQGKILLAQLRNRSAGVIPSPHP